MKIKKIIISLICILVIFIIGILYTRQITQKHNNKFQKIKQFQDKSIEIILSEDNNWKKVLNLDKYDENGKLILYEIDEKQVPAGYSKHVEEMAIINKLEEYRYYVEYYFDEIINEKLTECYNAPYGQEISTYKDKIVENNECKLDRIENLGMKISSDERKNVIKIYYVSNKKDKSKGILEKHINEITNEFLENPIYHTFNQGDEYNIQPKEFKNFEVDREKLPENATGVMDEELIEVLYYYQPKKRQSKNNIPR